MTGQQNAESVDVGKRLGGTGTRHGMTDEQLRSADWFIVAGGWSEMHLGDCEGADEEMHGMASGCGIRLVGHPPVDHRLRAFCEYDECWDERPYLDRDRDIVDETDELLATPADDHEIEKGGTWYTVRYARSQGRPVTIIWPDGTVQEEQNDGSSPSAPGGR